MNKTVVIVLGLVLAGGVFWAMSNKGETSNDAMMPAPSEVMEEKKVDEMVVDSPETMMEESSAAKVVVVEGNEFTFNADKITLKKGEKVKLVFKNTGKMTHDFVVDELSVRTKVIAGGAEDMVEFTPTEAGSYEFYCSVGKHREMGMVGTLTVTE